MKFFYGRGSYEDKIRCQLQGAFGKARKEAKKAEQAELFLPHAYSHALDPRSCRDKIQIYLCRNGEALKKGALLYSDESLEAIFRSIKLE